MKYFFIILSFFILGSCSKSEPNLSITCGGDGESEGKKSYINFDFKEGIVAVKDVPTAYGLKINKLMVDGGVDEVYTEKEYELKILESSPSFIKYGFDMELTAIEIYYVLDRGSLELSSYTEYTNRDGTLMDMGEGINNPMTSTESCKKPIV